MVEGRCDNLWMSLIIARLASVQVRYQRCDFMDWPHRMKSVDSRSDPPIFFDECHVHINPSLYPDLARLPYRVNFSDHTLNFHRPRLLWWLSIWYDFMPYKCVIFQVTMWSPDSTRSWRGFVKLSEVMNSKVKIIKDYICPWIIITLYSIKFYQFKQFLIP